MIPKLDPFDASEIIKNGGNAIYPTEGIYGIGCDPFNESSVENIFKVKGRDLTKNFIILTSNINYLKRIIDNNLFENKALVDGSFTTWVVATNKDCPPWLTTNKSIAIRITNHPVVDELCVNLGGPIISTSANCSNQKYINDITTIENIFDGKIDCIVKGQLGNKKRSSIIKNILTNEILRH
jgi:tRNA threonylcarbamoyl adenosine modification protein (Sua5/YciO/YrdC/YwlC family)